MFIGALFVVPHPRVMLKTAFSAVLFCLMVQASLDVVGMDFPDIKDLPDVIAAQMQHP